MKLKQYIAQDILGWSTPRLCDSHFGKNQIVSRGYNEEEGYRKFRDSEYI